MKSILQVDGQSYPSPLDHDNECTVTAQNNKVMIAWNMSRCYCIPKSSLAVNFRGAHLVKERKGTGKALAVSNSMCFGIGIW